MWRRIEISFNGVPHFVALLLACPTFCWQQEESKGHYSKKSNCVRLVRQICIPSLPFSEKYSSFEVVFVYISSNGVLALSFSLSPPLSLSPSHAQFLINPKFPFLLESLKSLSSSSWCKTMYIYFGGSLF